MAYVIAKPCLSHCRMECLDACENNAIHPNHEEQSFKKEVERLYIDAQKCEECENCSGVCPAGAIYHEDDLPANLKKYVKINENYFQTDII